MPNTTNFNWATPADTDLVKDGAAAIRTLGNSIDSSFVDLKGGTTGQNLRKASNTDLDFTFAGDATNTVVDAAGDLLYGTAADTLGRLAIGTAGQILKVNSGATAPEWAAPATAGGLTQLATGTLSGATVSLTSISGSYKHLQLVIRNFLPGNDNAQFNLRANGDSTANRHRTEFADGIQENITFNATVWNPHGHNDNATGDGLIIIHIWDYANTTTWKVFESFTISNDATTPANANYYNNAGAYNQTGAITSLDLLPSGGSFTSGTYILYGVS